MSGFISSYGLLSSVTGSSTQWSTTTADDQVITFTDTAGNALEVNALTLYASGSPLYVQMNNQGVVYIGANDNLSINGMVIKSITFVGGSPLSYRFYAMYK